MAVKSLRKSAWGAVMATALFAACGTGSEGDRSTADAVLTTPVASDDAAAPTTSEATTRLVLNVNLETDVGEATAETVYVARFDDADWGLLPADDMMTGIAGFGVDSTGTLHIVDGSRHRVIVVATDGTMTVGALPQELDSVVVRGFAVGPDGVLYLTLNDGAAVVSDNTLIGRFSSAELGWDSAPLRPVATEDGMWVQSDGQWVLALSPAGAVVTGTASDAGVEASPDGPRIGVQYDGTTAVLRGVNDKGLSFEVTVGSIGGGGPYFQQFVGDDLVWVLQPSHEELVVIFVRADGTYSTGRIPIPAENRVAAGLYVKVTGGFLWLETGDSEAVTVRRIGLATLGATA